MTRGPQSLQKSYSIQIKKQPNSNISGFKISESYESRPGFFRIECKGGTEFLLPTITCLAVSVFLSFDMIGKT